jgi:hypothetical protein
MNIPPQTGQIFQILSQGAFISENSFYSDKALFEIIAQSQSELHTYFLPLGFELKAGEGFFYFISLQNDQESEDKIEQAIKLIEWVDFFKSYTPEFGAGYVFTVEGIQRKCQDSALLRRKLEQMNTRGGQGKLIDRIRQVVRQLEKQGFVELLHEPTEKYQALAAFSFLESWAQKIELV